MMICGIDPGLSGALCFLKQDAVSILDMPLTDRREVDGDRLLELFSSSMTIIVEDVHGPACFKFGQAFGSLLVAATASRNRLVRVAPRTWQAAMLPSGVDTKKASVLAAAMLVPPPSLIRGRGRKHDHNRSDAVCIAHWGLKHA